MSSLYQRSIEIIQENQSRSGAYVACPEFPTYSYCWFRDGSFIAYAMDLAGKFNSAGRFHTWAAGSILKHREVVERAVEKARAGHPLGISDILHTRYTLDGDEVETGEWPNFQLDGFGTWLWALGEHLRLAGESLFGDWALAADLVADYLAALWPLPCYDCWEEFPDKVHPHTLAAIYAGLQAHSRFTGRDHRPVLRSIRAFLFERAIVNGHFVKFIGSRSVDASLLGLATPYRVVEPEHPALRETVARIEAELVRGGGVHRYAEDTYYGGGEWVLLAGWLGWYHVEAGNPDRALSLLHWMEAQADEHGRLPEQVPASLNDANYLEPWVQRWGPSACPLLWSHAKYLILYSKLKPYL